MVVAAADSALAVVPSAAAPAVAAVAIADVAAAAAAAVASEADTHTEYKPAAADSAHIEHYSD